MASTIVRLRVGDLDLAHLQRHAHGGDGKHKYVATSSAAMTTNLPALCTRFNGMNGNIFISPRPALQGRAEEGLQAVSGRGGSQQTLVV